MNWATSSWPSGMGSRSRSFRSGSGRRFSAGGAGETEYVLAALPLGGFVKMLGEGPDEQESKSTDPRAYPNKSVSARMAIISAGVIMNLFLAVGLLRLQLHEGARRGCPPCLGAVAAGSRGLRGGLAPGDEIVAIDDRPDPGLHRTAKEDFAELRKVRSFTSRSSARDMRD